MKKTIAKSKRLIAFFLSAVLICTMLQCTFLTAFADDATINSLISTVNADGKVTLSDATSINKISVLYDALDDTTKAGYTDTVNSLKTALYALLSEGQTQLTNETTKFNKDYWSFISAVDNAVRVKYSSGNNPEIASGPHAQGKDSVSNADTALDGLEILINNYHQYDKSGATRAGFAVQFTKWEYQNSGVNYTQLTTTSRTGMILHFDLLNNEIIINSRLASGEAMKVGKLSLDEGAKSRLTLSNFEHKAIAIGMRATGDAENPYQVVIKISGDATPIVANIPALYYDDAITNSGKVCIAFPAGYWATPTSYASGKIATSFDVIGYRNSKTSEADIEAINNIVTGLDEANVKESDAKAINEAVIGFEKLSAFDKEHTPNTDKLETLKTALLAILKDGYTTFSGTSDFTVQGTWGIMSYEDSAARYKFGNIGSIALRHGPRASMELDGLELKFHRLHQTATASKAGFGIQFTPGSSNLGSTAYATELTGNKGLLLYFDLVNGKLILNYKKTTAAASSSNVVYSELVTNDKLKLANLQGKAFTVGFLKTNDASNPYKVIITVADGTAPLEVNIPSNCFDESVVTSSGRVHVAFNRGYYTSSIASPSSTAVNTAFDFVGYRDMSASAAYIEYIKTNLATLDLDTLTEASVKVVNKMATYYETLIPMEKAQIDSAKLEAIVSKMATLVKQGMTIFENFTTDYWTSLNWFTKTADYARFNLSQTTLNPQLRIGPTTALAFDGLELKFNNLQLTSTAGTSAGFGIIYALSAGYEFKTTSSGLLLYIDAKNGDLILNLNGNSVYRKLISGSDVLKLSSLEYNSFTVKTSSTNDDTNPYKVTVTTADGQTVSADIPAECFDSSKILSGGKTYVSICRGRYDETGGESGSVYNRFDLVGYKNVAAIDKVNNLIASIPATVTLKDSGLVNRTMQYYENLTDEQKTLVTGVDKLNAAVARVEALYNESLKDTDYKIITGNAELVSKIEDMNDWWLTEFTALENGGLRIDWLNATLDIRASLKEAVNMNGFRLKFNRMLQKGANGEFAIYFANGSANEYNRDGNSDFALVFNVNEGTLKVATSWDVVGNGNPVYVDVISNKLLKYDSIGGGEFVLGLDRETNGNYKVTVTVGDESVSGIIEKTVFDTVSGKLSNLGNCYVCVSAWSGVSMSLDVIGYKTVPDVYVPEVNAWIASLPQEITLNDCETLDKIYEKLLIANEEQLAEIANKEKFYTSMKAYRKLLSTQTETLSHTYIALAGAEDWWPTSFKCLGIENDGGLRMSWINGGRDVRQGYNKNIRLDGLKLQFNALHKLSDSAQDPALTVLLSDTVGAAWTYNNTVTTRPLAVVLDTEDGTLSVHPTGSVIARSDKLKFENLEYGVFYIEFNLNDNKLWQVDVVTPTGTVSGEMSTEDFTAGERFTNPDSGCFVTITMWRKAYATVEWTGLGQSTKHWDTTALIDKLRVVDADSGDEIEAARKSYDALPGYVQNRVANYQILVDAEAKFLGIDKNYNPVPYVEERIAALGKIDITSKKDIDDVLELYYTLSTAQQNKLKNKNVLQQAIETYHKLYAEHMDWDSCVYAPLAGDAYYSQETLDSWWNGTLKFYDIESGGIRIDMKNASRDHRASFGSYELDGLNIQLSNYKINGEGIGTGVLAISVGPFAPYDYGKGLSTRAKRSSVFVLDTNEGTLTLNTTGNKYITKNVEMFKSEKLKYSNIQGKNFSLMFEEIDSFNYTVRFMISDGTLFSYDIPSSIIFPLLEQGKLTNIYIQVGAWNNGSNQSVDLVSVFDNNFKNAVSQVMPVIEEIDALPTTVTIYDEAQIRAAREHYRTLLKKGLKEQVGNYEKLDSALLRLSEIWDLNGMDPYEFEFVEEEEEKLTTYAAQSPVATELPVTQKKSSATKGTATIFISILSLGGLVLFVKKKSKKEETNND